MPDVYVTFKYGTETKKLESIRINSLDELKCDYGYTGEILREDAFGMTLRIINCVDYKDAISTILLGASEFYSIEEGSNV